jgi:hypothetical protein
MELRKFIKTTIREYLNEQNNLGNRIVAYHGTRSFLPFQKFETTMIGTGLVSSGGAKYDGFFFTTEKENAEYYTEYFVCKVTVNDVKPNPTESKHPNTVLSLGLKNKQNYIVEDVLDGAVFSDIIIVPKNNLGTINIVEWEFVGDEETIFEKWDETFGDEDGFVNTDMIDDILEMINLDLNFLIKIPIFRKYYEGKK